MRQPVEPQSKGRTTRSSRLTSASRCSQRWKNVLIMRGASTRFRGEGVVQQAGGAARWPTSCRPTGRPVARGAAGERNGGMSRDKLNSCVLRSIGARTASVPPFTCTVAAPIGGAGIARAGAASTSTPASA